MTIQLLFFVTVWSAIGALLGWAVIGTLDYNERRRIERRR